MQTKSALRVLGTLLLLLGIFGYLFPTWHHTTFTNNENLFHLVTGLLAIFTSHLALKTAKWSLVVWALIYLTLGIYGFSLKHPADFHIKHITAQLDLFDSIAHVIFALGFSWFWLSSRKPS